MNCQFCGGAITLSYESGKAYGMCPNPACRAEFEEGRVKSPPRNASEGHMRRAGLYRGPETAPQYGPTTAPTAPAEIAALKAAIEAANAKADAAAARAAAAEAAVRAARPA